jgi:type II restriction enzyme
VIDAATQLLIERWRSDPHSTYTTWFLWPERLKNFRSIRRGIELVIDEINAGTFGNSYRGSSLETAVKSIAEQRQMFKGADHAFLWKPKLRIPDIYEHAENQRAFARLLHTCNCCDTFDAIVEAIQRIDTLNIKGLGPAVANLLYFIHPTLVPPFNTAIVNGYNALTGSKVKLGRWDHFLTMREGIARLNADYRALLSNDLGAVAGLLFDIGSGRYAAPPIGDDATLKALWQADLEKVREESSAAQKRWIADQSEQSSHTDMQGAIRDLGLSLGFDVWIASNDRNRAYRGGELSCGCLNAWPVVASDSVKLIDVVWFEKGQPAVAAAFEVEHSTSIYSGIMRMLDLILSPTTVRNAPIFIVAPNARREDVFAQWRRPAFAQLSHVEVRYLPYQQLQDHGVSITRFGQGLKPMLEVSERLR